MVDTMDDQAFDASLISAAFALAGETGWKRLRVAEAARRAGLPLDRARLRCPGGIAVLVKFGRLADAAALRGAPADGPERDRLFDILMRRYEFLEAHRAGVEALMRRLPADPPLALLLHRLTLRSMRWMLEGAGISAAGLDGCLRAQGLEGVWLLGLRAWRDDASEDLASTMSALDKALARAERFASWLPGGRRAAAPADNDVSMAETADLAESAAESATDRAATAPDTKPEPEPPAAAAPA
jgi:ubiquinone biosynthesis protein COQ9